jgi:shikimate kinase
LITAQFSMHGNRVFLVGLMGAGKTTIGQMLAKRLNMKFVDSDHVLEERTGASIATIFEVEGEASFRQREAAIVDELSCWPGIVLATGGGAVNDLLSRDRLRGRGTVIYLHTSAELAFERIKRNRERPLLNVHDPLLKLAQLYQLRHANYLAAAHHVVESHKDRPALVVAEIATLIMDSGSD